MSATRPDQTHGQSPYMSRLSGQVYNLTKSADLSETQAVGGSGLVGSAWWNLGTTRPDPTSDKVWSGPSSKIWATYSKQKWIIDLLSIRFHILFVFHLRIGLCVMYLPIKGRCYLWSVDPTCLTQLALRFSRSILFI